MEQCPDCNILCYRGKVKMLKSKWSDCKFKGGNHSVRNHYSIMGPENLPDFSI